MATALPRTALVRNPRRVLERGLADSWRIFFKLVVLPWKGKIVTQARGGVQVSNVEVVSRRGVCPGSTADENCVGQPALEMGGEKSLNRGGRKGCAKTARRTEFVGYKNGADGGLKWSGVRDSNPFRRLGKPGHDPYTNPALGSV